MKLSSHHLNPETPPRPVPGNAAASSGRVAWSCPPPPPPWLSRWATWWWWRWVPVPKICINQTIYQARLPIQSNDLSIQNFIVHSNIPNSPTIVFQITKTNQTLPPLCHDFKLMKTVSSFFPFMPKFMGQFSDAETLAELSRKLSRNSPSHVQG